MTIETIACSHLRKMLIVYLNCCSGQRIQVDLSSKCARAPRHGRHRSCKQEQYCDTGACIFVIQINSESLIFKVIIPATTFKNKPLPQQRVASSSGSSLNSLNVATADQAPPASAVPAITKSLKGGVKGVTKRSFCSYVSKRSKSRLCKATPSSKFRRL